MSVTRLPPAAVQVSEPGIALPAAGGLVLIAAAVVLLGETLACSDRPTLAVAWGGVALAVYLAGLLCLTGSRYQGLGVSQWKCGPWMLAWYGIAFGLVTVTWDQPRYGVLAEVTPSGVLRALWLVAVAMTAWAVGYQMGPGRRARGAAARGMAALGRRLGPDVRSLAAPWILYGLGAAARIVTVVTTGRLGYVGTAPVSAGSYTEFLAALGLCCPLAIAAASLQAFGEGRSTARWTVAVLLAAEALTGAVSGGKASFVVAVLAAAIPYGAARRRLPWKTLAATALFFLVVVIPFSQAYRADVQEGLTPGQAVAAAPGVLRDAMRGQTPLWLAGGSLTYLGRRVSEIGNPAIILQRVPSAHPYLSPADLVAGPADGLVPRALWPGKPVMATGETFAREFFGQQGTSTDDTMPGGLYWHGGWIPLLAGMLLLGCGVRLLDGALDVRENPHAVFLVLLILPALAGAEEDWNSVLASLPATLAVWLLACLLTFRRKGQGFHQ